MKIALVTNPYELTFEAEKINRLFELGLDLLHIRKPSYSKKEIAKLIEKIDAQFHSKIVLHNHFSLAAKYKLKGIHINRGQRKSVLFNLLSLKRLKMMKDDLSISSTVHSLNGLKAKKDDLDYVFVGPFFNRHSAKRLATEFSRTSTKKVLDRNTNVYLFGGVSHENIDIAKELGVQGIALQGCIWKSADPIASYHEIVNEVNKSNSNQKVAQLAS